jgi:NAD+ diphosphatase
VVVGPEGVLVSDAPHPRPARLALSDVGGDLVLLGLENGHALFAAPAGTAPAETRTIGLREAGTLLRQDDGGLVAYAAGMLNWHRRHPHCAVCGSKTEPAEAGHVRRCPSCGAIHHPRTDPVVIMVVTDGDRALLGRQPTWAPGRYSALAGFVEPGESLEEAVAREVREEAHIEVTDARYVSSQPWPFPASLMLGFTARSDGGEPVARDGELAEVAWFSRERVVAAAAGDDSDFGLPPPVSIARFLIDRWLAEG